MYISRVALRNIRCFDSIDIEFRLEGEQLPWSLIIGDNATGKSAFLKAIALGLCDVSSAAALLRESDAGYIRHGAGEGSITIELADGPHARKKYSITTFIEKVGIRGNKTPLDFYERVTQKVSPAYKSFPWGKVFACGYGPNRGTMGTGDIAGYSVINAVYNMFNYTEGLQNPELVIRRTRDGSKNFKTRKFLQALEQIVLGHLHRSGQYHFALNDHGISATGPWGSYMPLRDLADGYKSTFLWITDFIGWALSYNPNISNTSEIEGILLIDEIEQHLHPKWQQSVVRELKVLFPRVQFISSTHSPLVASSLAQESLERAAQSSTPASHIRNSSKSSPSRQYRAVKKGGSHDRVLHLYRGRNERVCSRELSIDEMWGWDTDQILGSGVFDYVSRRTPGLEELFKNASELLSKGSRRSSEEETEFNRVRNLIKSMMPMPGVTPIERELTKESLIETQAKILELEKKISEQAND